MKTRAICALIGLFLIAADAQAQVNVRLRSRVATTQFSITSPGDFPDGVAGEAYTTQVITTVNASGSVTCAVTAGSLPAWMTESSECTYSASGATTAATTVFTITATDSDGGETSSRQMTIIIAAAATVPSPWQCSDVGSGGATAGSGSESSGTWTITGAGSDFDASSTGLHYCWQSVTGNKQITVRVTGCTIPNPPGFGGRCGVAIRSDLTAGSANASLVIKSADAPTARLLQWRPTAGAVTSSSAVTNTHEYLRLVNTGGQITFWSSPDNSTYIQLQGLAQDITLASTYTIGMLVYSNAISTLATGTITTVTVETPTPTSPTPDFGGYRPEFQGYGSDTVGGRGGPHCTVNSLATTGGTFSANGTGTIRDCTAARSGCVDTAATCARTVLFSVSGNIDLNGVALDLTSPFLTIAGQTAPSPGISVIDGPLYINAPQIVIQHVRFRLGKDRTGSDVVYVAGKFVPVHHVILDHVSISYGTHEGLGVNAQALGGTNGIYPTSLLFWRIINGQNLDPVGATSAIGQLFFGNYQLAGLCTTAHSYFVHNGNRNPWYAAGWTCANINNLAYNAKCQAGADGKFGFQQLTDAQSPTGPLVVAYIGNVNVAGPDSVSCDGTISIEVDAASLAAGGTKLYMSDNTGPGITGATADGQWAGVFFTGSTNVGTRANSECDTTCYNSTTMAWFRNMNFQTLASTAVQADVVADVGARPLDRDNLDTEIVADVGQLDGGILPAANQPAFQTLATNSHTLSDDIPANPTDVASGQTFRTNLEVWLETCADKWETNIALVCVD